MTALEIGIAIAVALVLLTVWWSVRSERGRGPSRRPRQPDVRQRGEERDLL